ncbi:MAG: D-tyrosyl-tRNA(Tyr) deacylase [Chlamydiae bacterium RIFCSPHIGHO2_12_FULL_49_11]|nr:MAG: D-tyrosyl-tRNA(Tyr) deacylase [Chlamydiae bacterium RIFCSPHIGHO2_12_FULL_49_11]
MKVVVQRVKEAEVKVDGKTVGAIGGGLLLLIGFAEEDTREMIAPLVQKIVSMRIFDDENGKMNLSLIDVQGDALLVSQFTLVGDTIKGNRPSFIRAKKPAVALEFFHASMEEMRKLCKGNVSAGIFGAHMEVSLTNDGPVTFVVEFPRP